tara:strand:+ start:2376 stop:3677 length:1302 start_codon:yes stop_codon:yes gene_type:complete
MGTTISPSDFTEINPSYTNGRGFYTNATEVANLLQIPSFSGTTYPTTAQVGAIIKRVEGIVDDKVKRSFRPIVTKDEYHNFEFTRGPKTMYYGGYVGFIQLKQMKVRKIVSLQLWQGSHYEEIASAQAKVLLQENFRDLNSIILELPNDGVAFELIAENDIAQLGNDEFSNTFGVKTTSAEVVNVINEQFPSTAQYTGATAPKSLTNSNLSISDFFYASKDKSNGKQINISSLLLSDDGSDCVVKATIKQSCTTVNASTGLTVANSAKLAVGMVVTGTGITGTITIASITDATNVILSGQSNTSATNDLTFTTTSSIPTVCDLTSFTDKDDMKRLGDYWTINEEGRVFFLKEFPYHTNNSIIVSYIAGDNRVPSAIHEATTKLVCSEIIRMDDQSVLISETGGNITAKEKYDILRKEAFDILKGKGDLVYFLD